MTEAFWIAGALVLGYLIGRARVSHAFISARESEAMWACWRGNPSIGELDIARNFLQRTVSVL